MAPPVHLTALAGPPLLGPHWAAAPSHSGPTHWAPDATRGTPQPRLLGTRYGMGMEINAADGGGGLRPHTAGRAPVGRVCGRRHVDGCTTLPLWARPLSMAHNHRWEVDDRRDGAGRQLGGPRGGRRAGATGGGYLGLARCGSRRARTGHIERRRWLPSPSADAGASGRAARRSRCGSLPPSPLPATSVGIRPSLIVS